MLRKKTFPVVTDGPFRTLCRVHPLMQKAVKQVLDVLYGVDVKVIIFGSAITYDCTSFSDLDLALSSYTLSMDELSLLYKRLAMTIVEYCSYDIIIYNELKQTDSIRHEIDTKGLVIKDGVQYDAFRSSPRRL